MQYDEKYVEQIYIYFDVRPYYNTQWAIRLRYISKSFGDTIGGIYKWYIHSAKRRGKEFNLSEQEFNNIVKRRCYLCGKKSRGNHKNGVDRVDNEKGYDVDNCKSCRCYCNMMKKDMDHERFLNKCEQVAILHYENLNDLLSLWMPSRFLEPNVNKIKLSDAEKEAIKEKKGIERHQKTMSSKTSEAIEKEAKRRKDVYLEKKRSENIGTSEPVEERKSEKTMQGKKRDTHENYHDQNTTNANKKDMQERHADISVES